MVYSGIQQIVYRTADDRILRFGHCDFASQPDFDGATETVVENGYIFGDSLKLRKYSWTGSAVSDDGAYTKKSTKEILTDIEAASTTQEWLDIQAYIDAHYMLICCLGNHCYTKARARVQKAYDDAEITEALYDLIMAEIPTEDIP